MKCPNCGTDMEKAGSVNYRCIRCGTVVNMGLSLSDAPDKTAAPVNKRRENFCTNVRLDRLKRGVAATVAGFICFVTFTALRSLLSQPDLTNCFSVETVGTDGYGQLDFCIDQDKIARSVFGRNSREALNDCDKAAFDDIAAVLKSTGKINHSKLLSNGEEAVISISGVEELSDRTGISFSKDETRLTRIRGLDTSGELKAGDLFTVSAVGSDGRGCLKTELRDMAFPFTLSVVRGKPVIDGRYELNIGSSGNVGSLSNGEEAFISLYTDDRTASRLESKYGYRISDQPLRISVKGLPEAEDPLFITMPNYYVDGVSGSGVLSLRWRDEVLDAPGYRIEPDPNDNMSFFLYSKDPPVGNVYFASDSVSEVQLERFTLVPDKREGIAEGDRINIILLADGKDVSPEALASYGITCYCNSASLTVSNDYFDEPLDDADDLNTDLTASYAGAMNTEAQHFLRATRPDIRNVEVTSLSSKAVLTKPSPESSQLALWLIFVCPVCEGEDAYVLCGNPSLSLNRRRQELIPKEASSFRLFSSLDDVISYIDSCPHDPSYGGSGAVSVQIG